MDNSIFLQTPEHITVNNATYVIPTGFLVASVENAGESGNVILENVKGAQVILQPGSAFEYGFTGKGKTAIKVIATGAVAQLVYEI